MRAACLLLIIALLPARASAQVTAEDVAARAQAVHEQHCAEMEGTDEGSAARAIGEISAVWAEVSEVYEQTGAS